MKLKKLLLIVLTIIMVGAVVGCSGATDNANDDQKEPPKSTFPEKEIRFVVPYNPGGASDSTARTVAKVIKDEGLLPVDITVVNLPGANTRIGLEEVLNAKPDGYTILLHHSTLNAMNSVGQIDISYEDYDLIAQVSYTPNVLVGHADAEYKTFVEYVEAAKKNPGSISIGVPAVGSTTHLSFEAMMQKTGNQDIFDVIPYQSGADLIAAHMGGQVDLRMASTPDSIQYVESGDVIPLVTTSYERHWNPLLKDAISFKELGLDIGVNVRFGFYAPKGTPKEVIDQLEDVFKQVTETAAFKEFVANNGTKEEFLSTEEFLDSNKKVQDMFNELAKNITVN